MRNRLILGVLALAAAAIAVALARSGRAQDAQAAPDTLAAYEAPVDLDTAKLPGPRQPILYRHDIHAGQYEMECQYCHRNIELSPKPGIPPMESCRGCHLIVGTGDPEVEKLREHFNENRPVEWIEIHQLSPFVHFPHHRHVLAQEDEGEEELECETCHGQVDRMPQVYQYASLKMGWCITCHEEREVTTDCTACHY
jgi:hypothetical protein